MEQKCYVKSTGFLSVDTDMEGVMSRAVMKNRVNFGEGGHSV